MDRHGQPLILLIQLSCLSRKVYHRAEEGIVKQSNTSPDCEKGAAKGSRGTSAQENSSSPTSCNHHSPSVTIRSRSSPETVDTRSCSSSSYTRLFSIACRPIELGDTPLPNCFATDTECTGKKKNKHPYPTEEKLPIPTASSQKCSGAQQQTRSPTQFFF